MQAGRFQEKIKIMTPELNEGPLLSVIVPVYNGRNHLRSCLEALASPAGLADGEWEVIVVDDGSTDGSAELTAEFLRSAGPGFRLIRQERNLGAAASRNRGAKEARSDLLVFVDVDVFLRPEALSALRKVFEDRPEVQAAVGRYTETPAAPGLINLYHNAFTRHHHDLSPPEIDWFWGALAAVRKSAFLAAGGFDERYHSASAEDMEFGRTLASSRAKIVYCPEAEGAHAHDFSLGGMLKNDYRKAVLGTKLLLSGRLPRRAPAFANYRNLATVPLLLVPLLYAAGCLSVPLLGVFLCLGLIFVVNDPFYLYLTRLFGREVYVGVFLHWLQMFTIAAGAVMGAVGHLLGRSAYGRPGWF